MPATGHIEFADNALLTALYGPADQHIAMIEEALGVNLYARGNVLYIDGNSEVQQRAHIVLSNLYERLQAGQIIESSDVRVAILESSSSDYIPSSQKSSMQKSFAGRIKVTPRTTGQADYFKALQHSSLTFGIGPAGCGKTYLAVSMAVMRLMNDEVERIILSRPAVEAGERLGFLPGSIQEKIHPYLRPLYDALYDMMSAEQINRRLTNGEIEIAPLAYMRGRTLRNAAIILDEAQNTTPEQMKMFLTRLGEGSYMTITGDLGQIDLPGSQKCGLAEAVRRLATIEEIKIITMGAADIVRPPLVSKIVAAYERDNSSS